MYGKFILRGSIFCEICKLWLHNLTKFFCNFLIIILSDRTLPRIFFSHYPWKIVFLLEISEISAEGYFYSVAKNLTCNNNPLYGRVWNTYCSNDWNHVRFASLVFKWLEFLNDMHDWTIMWLALQKGSCIILLVNDIHCT